MSAPAARGPVDAFLDSPGVLPGFAAGTRSRAVSAGLDPYLYDRVTGSLDTLRAWPEAFARTARERRDAARTAEAAGHGRSAGEAYREAALWFHFATVLPHPDRTGHAAAADCMRRALAHLDPTAEQVSGGLFAGVLRRPPGSARPPLALVVPGMDSGKEEFVSVADCLLARGLAVLALDGPGQGELAPTTAPLAGYHRVVSEAIDAVSERQDLDASAIGLVALSLGGFYGALSLAHEPRLLAGVTVSGPYALTWDDLPPFVTATLTLRAGGEAAAREFTRQVDLSGVAPRITQPLLVVDGEHDVIPGVVNGEPLARQAVRGEHLMVAGGDHLAANARWAWLPRSADRLAGLLCDRASGGHGGAGERR